MRNIKITYLRGDATQPQGKGNKIIPHICNDIGAWGAGFVLALSRRWSEPEQVYRSLNKWDLTNVHFIQVEDDITIANMIAQVGIGRRTNGSSPLSYSALRVCLSKVNDYAVKHNATLHMPKIGAGLAGGDWNQIEKIILSVMSVDVYVYLFE